MPIAQGLQPGRRARVRSRPATRLRRQDCAVDRSPIANRHFPEHNSRTPGRPVPHARLRDRVRFVLRSPRDGRGQAPYARAGRAHRRNSTPAQVVPDDCHRPGFSRRSELLEHPTTSRPICNVPIRRQPGSITSAVRHPILHTWISASSTRAASRHQTKVFPQQERQRQDLAGGIGKVGIDQVIRGTVIGLEHRSAVLGEIPREGKPS